MSVTDWSPQPSGNALADPSIKAARDGASARELSPSIRGLMAKTAAFALDQGGALVSTGTENAYEISTNSGFTEIKPGVTITFEADRANTGSPTLNVDGAGPRTWVDADGSALAAGSVKRGRLYAVVWTEARPDRPAAWRNAGPTPAVIGKGIAEMSAAERDGAREDLGAVWETLPAVSGTLARPTDGKIRERRTILDFIPWQRHAEIRDGTISEAVDLKDSMALAAAFAKQPFCELVIPGGVYPYSVSPNWAGNHVRIITEGNVRFRHTGTADAFICDSGPVVGGVAPHTFGMQIGSPGAPIIIEGSPNTKNGAFLRALNHSDISLNVRGCSGIAFYIEFGVCSVFHLRTSVNDGGWFKGARPALGLVTERRIGDPADASPPSFLAFPNIVIEGVKKAGEIRSAGKIFFFYGTMEACTEYGLEITRNAYSVYMLGTDFEVNASYDIFDNGTDTQLVSMQALAQDAAPPHGLTPGVLLGAFSNGMKIRDSQVHNITALNGAKNAVIDGVRYNFLGSSDGSIYEVNGPNSVFAIRNSHDVKNDRWHDALPSRTVLTLPATASPDPYVYTNTLRSPVTVTIVGGAGSGGGPMGYVFKSRGGILAEINPCGFVRLQPGESIGFIYTTKPTVVVLS